jgi:hypothetical protein
MWLRTGLGCYRGVSSSSNCIYTWISTPMGNLFWLKLSEGAVSAHLRALIVVDAYFVVFV